VACHDYGRWGVEAAVTEAWRRHGAGELKRVDSLAMWRVR